MPKAHTRLGIRAKAMADNQNGSAERHDTKCLPDTGADRDVERAPAQVGPPTLYAHSPRDPKRDSRLHAQENSGVAELNDLLLG